MVGNSTIQWETVTMYYRAISALEWQPVPRWAVMGVTVVVAYLTWQHDLTTDQWVMLLDHTNLIIHEAGHPIVGVLSHRLAVYGGTVFQLLFPLLFACHFWRQRHSLGWAAALVWFGESLMNVGRYMRDARAQELPLVGGGEHDWTEIFSRWGLLAWDVRLGNTTRLLGLGTTLWAVLWLWRYWRATDRPNPSVHRTRHPRRAGYEDDKRV
jgi:hypothetical protein